MVRGICSDEGYMLFPAGAGVIPEERNKEIEETTFPRRCGGEANTAYMVMKYMAATPQMRG